jgi:transposase-like protein
MTQHFLLSAKARTLSLGAVMRMTDQEAEQTFMAVRWADTEGKPVCPHCACPIVWDCRKANGAPRWRCKACRKCFSITSGTLFAFHKLSLRDYLAAVVIFCNEVKGKSALALSRDLDVQHKTAFVLSHKIREAMATEMRGMRVGGEGKIVETDGAYFGGHIRPANHKENRRDRRLAKNQNGKRQSLVIVRERGGSTIPAVFKSEASAVGWIKSRVKSDTHIMADEAPGWNDLEGRYEVSRIDHSQLYSDQNGTYTNGAESFFSRIRRAEVGHHHHISGRYLLRYGQESAWRENHRRMDNGSQVKAVTTLAMAAPVSVDWCGYWQRAGKKA